MNEKSYQITYVHPAPWNKELSCVAILCPSKEIAILKDQEEFVCVALSYSYTVISTSAFECL